MTKSVEAEIKLALYVQVEGTVDTGDAGEPVTVDHVWLRHDGLPDLDISRYLGQVDTMTCREDLQEEHDRSRE